MNYDKVIADLTVRVQELEEETIGLGQTIDVMIQAFERFVPALTDAIIMVDERIKKSENVR